MEIIIINFLNKEFTVHEKSENILNLLSGLMIVVLTFYNTLHSTHYGTLS